MKHKILPYVGASGGIAALATMAILAAIARRSEVPTHHLHMAEDVAPRGVVARTVLREDLAPPPVQVPTVASLPKSRQRPSRSSQGHATKYPTLQRITEGPSFNCVGPPSATCLERRVR